MNVISPIGARTILGPISAYLLGSLSLHTVGGSTTWSSTEMIIGISGTRRVYGIDRRADDASGQAAVGASGLAPPGRAGLGVSQAGSKPGVATDLAMTTAEAT